MKKCLAYRNPRGARDAWIPCGRDVVSGSYFCQRHEDAISAAIVGLLVHGFPEAAVAKDGYAATKTPTLEALDRTIRRGRADRPRVNRRTANPSLRQGLQNDRIV